MGQELLPQGVIELGHHLVQAVEEAPGHKGEGSPVPQAADKEHDRHVEAGAGFAPPAAAQGEVEIVLEPAGQGDVPAPPEILDGGGEVGAVEVLHKAEAQHFGRAPGDVGVGGEIAVNLEGKGHGGHQEGPAPLVLGVVVHGVHHGGQVVGDDHLFEQAPQHRVDAGLDVLVAEGVVLLELVEDVAGALDGPGHQLGEEGDEQGVVDEVLLRFHVLAVDIDGVAQGLEGVEGDAHGQEHVQQGHVQAQARGVDRVGQKARGEVVILEEEQHPQVEEEAEGHPEPPLAPHRVAYQQAAAVGDGGGEQHEQGVGGVPAHVEEVAGQQQLDVPGAAGQQVIDQQVEPQEQQVLDGIEIQSVRSFLSRYCCRAAPLSWMGFSSASSRRVVKCSTRCCQRASSSPSVGVRPSSSSCPPTYREIFSAPR